MTTLPALEKKIRYKAHHRGSKEADFLIGGFVEKCLDEDQFSLEDLHTFIDRDDPDVFRVANTHAPQTAMEEAFYHYLGQLGRTQEMGKGTLG